MSISAVRISELILEQLAQRQMQVLSLVVAIRKTLGASHGIKGDLGSTVRSALRTLIAARKVIDVDGMYVLVKTEDQEEPKVTVTHSARGQFEPRRIAERGRSC